MQHGDARFESVADAQDAVREGGSKMMGRVANRVGWRRLNADGRWEYLVHPEGWRSEVCKDLNPQFAAKVLADHGLLVPGDGGFQRKETIPGEGRIRVYVLSGAILDSD